MLSSTLCDGCTHRANEISLYSRVQLMERLIRDMRPFVTGDTDDGNMAIHIFATMRELGLEVDG